MYIVNSSVELDTDVLGFVWEDYYEKNRKVGIYCKIFYKDEHDPTADGSLDVIIYDNKPGFTIKGSLRKFYHGKSTAVADLTLLQFRRCITTIAKRLKVPVKEIWYADFTFMEFGANIVLPAMYQCLLLCLSTFTRRKKDEYKGETVYFKNQSRESKFYDKLLEIQGKSGMSKKAYEILAKFVLVFRYEVRIKPANIKDFSENRVIDVYNNWNLFVDYWLKEFEKVRFENKMPVKATSEGGLVGIKDFKNYFMSESIKRLGGLDEAEKIIRNSKAERKANIFRQISKAYLPNYDAEFVQMINTLNCKVKNKAEEKRRIM
ncbi:phage/plasmid replication protein [Flavobacterium sp. RNTU_13]|uniref:phage/plasmid replication domain-containing protein n=1 Tax=Flavobacterium sp. RNTU_13 TaxID=3375145 RepID=UPI003986CCBE